MSNRVCQSTILILGVGFSGCGGGPQTPPATNPPQPQTYTLKGVVRKVIPSTREVTIAHEAIPGFMPAMTMPFVLKEKDTIDDLRPGDQVEGPLRVVRDGDTIQDYELIDLIVTRPAIEPAPEPIAGPETVILKPGDPVPDFTVTTESGQTLKLSDDKGKVVVLTFIYTRCPLPDFCPAIDARFGELARRIAANPARADQVRLFSVSFDPAHDTPEVLKQHARRLGAKPPLWTFAVASVPELNRIAGPLGLTVIPGSREISHNLRTAVIDSDGRLIRLESGSSWTPSELMKTIYSKITN